MELTMAAQNDPTPWTCPVIAATCPKPDPQLHGRCYFSELGVVRRKPARPDAPPTLSKSCSDKLALKQCTSLLSSLTSLLVSPSNVYIHTLVVPCSQYSSIGMTRAFDSRMSPIKGKTWTGGYSFRPFNISTTELEFFYSRRQPVLADDRLAPSNVSSSWTANDWTETLIGGVLQGRKQSDIRGASRMCRRRMWKLAIEISRSAAVPKVKESLKGTYAEVKESELFNCRRIVKEDAKTIALAGWVTNDGGADFDVDGVEP